MIRTLSQLLVMFRDNLTRNITPENMRDFSDSAFGALQSGNPTVDDDADNTAGNGYFDFASRWINNTDGTIWECLDGTPGAAVWVKIYPQTATVGAPLTLQPPLDTDFALALKQHSPTQSAPLLKVIESVSGTQFGPEITGAGDLTNPNPLSGSGLRNERFGLFAGIGLTVGQDETFIGWSAGLSMQTGNGNTAIGSGALQTNFNGSGNTIVGSGAMNAGAGDENAVLGVNAMNQGSGSGNVCIGKNANAFPGANNSNIFIGAQAGYNFILGGGNTVVGTGAGNGGMTTENTLLGFSTNTQANTDTNSTVIGANAVGAGSDTMVFGAGITDYYFTPGAEPHGMIFTGPKAGFVPGTAIPSGAWLECNGTFSVPPCNCSASEIGAGTFVPGVFLDVTGLNPGLLPVGVMIAWSEIVGAPTFPATDGDDITVTTTNAYQTIFALTATYGIHGNCNLVNTGANPARVMLTFTDPNQGTQNTINVLNSGTQFPTFFMDLASGPTGIGRPPFTFIQLDVQSFNPGSPTTIQIYWSFILN